MALLSHYTKKYIIYAFPPPPMYNPLFILQVLLPNLQIFQQVVISRKRSISYVHWGLKMWEMQCWYKREDSQIGQRGKWLRDKRHWSVVLTINAKSILHFNTLGGLTKKKKKELIWLDHSQPYKLYMYYTKALFTLGQMFLDSWWIWNVLVPDSFCCLYTKHEIWNQNYPDSSWIWKLLSPELKN